jgi:hypothetical protein
MKIESVMPNDRYGATVSFPVTLCATWYKRRPTAMSATKSTPSTRSKAKTKTKAERAEIACADAEEALLRLAFETGPQGDRHRRHVLSIGLQVNRTISEFLKIRCRPLSVVRCLLRGSYDRGAGSKPSRASELRRRGHFCETKPFCTSSVVRRPLPAKRLQRSRSLLQAMTMCAFCETKPSPVAVRRESGPRRGTIRRIEDADLRANDERAGRGLPW